jgi:spore germination protein GerM
MEKKKNNLQTISALSIFFILVISLLFILSSCAQSVSLYFAYYEENEFYLVKEVRQIQPGDTLFKKTVEELVKGPESTALYPTIPSDVKVNSVDISGDTAVVDFSKEIITSVDEIPHSSTTEVLAIYSIVNTLTEFKEINKVKITVEGRDSGQINGFYIEDFWGHIGIYEEFTRNTEIIKNSQ